MIVLRHSVSHLCSCVMHIIEVLMIVGTIYASYYAFLIHI